MALVTGTLGAVTLSSGYAVKATGWTLSVDAPAQDATSWDDYASGGLWRSFVRGVKSWSGTITCRWDGATDVSTALDASVTLTLLLDSTSAAELGVSGTALLTSIAGTADMESVSTVTFTFQGTGALAVDSTGA